MPDDAAYLTHRNLVVRLAYDITGSWADAEDVAQQAYVRWRGVTREVENARAYLTRMATNLSLDVLANRERIGYVGPYLPEPVLTGPGADEAVAQADEVEVALMVVLGTLSPLERAVFLLHDVFAFTHDEVATMLGRKPAAIRKLGSRARSHIEARRPYEEVEPQRLAALTARFLAAAQHGDLSRLRELLTDDVVLVGDGGGKVTAARRPVTGRENVARLLRGLVTYLGPTTRLVPIDANHRIALAIYDGDQLDQVVTLLVHDGQIAQILAVRNPDKLAALARSLKRQPPAR